ncbi:MAG: methionine adenosyltransferase, partial [bacterium]|nr:methionine adenosyltransferase [bacterium]
ARVACETMTTTGLVMVTGEITTSTYIDISKIVRKTVADIGYTKPEHGLDARTCAVLTMIKEQSPDIACGVNHSLEEREHGEIDEIESQGAGDQGMMFGYACRETPELMPLPIMLAHKLVKQLTAVRKQGILDYLRPDGKSQVTVEYEDGKPVRVEAVVISAQHHPDVSYDTIKSDIIREVICRIVPKEYLDEKTKLFVNPTGKFAIGGPEGDAGLTGRKIIVDTYGGAGRHGGGAFSGKDPTKVDRSGAYMARYIAKNVVAAGLADRCELEVAYAIGIAHPVSLLVETFGTAKFDEEAIELAILDTFDLRPGAILRDLQLRQPIYQQTAAYGHFGRDDIDLPWERTDKVEALRQAINLKADEIAAEH